MKTITMHLNPISVKVKGDTKEELLENAKKEVIKQMEKQFPAYQYSINEGNVLTIENAHAGTIVKDNKGNLGIISGVNQKTINVTLTGGRTVQGSPELFKISKSSFEKARSKRQDFMKEMNEWGEGDTGYLKTKDGLKEVIVGKLRGKKYKLYVINGEGTHYQVTKEQLSLLKDDK